MAPGPEPRARTRTWQPEPGVQAAWQPSMELMPSWKISELPTAMGMMSQAWVLSNTSGLVVNSP